MCLIFQTKSWGLWCEKENSWSPTTRRDVPDLHRVRDSLVPVVEVLSENYVSFHFQPFGVHMTNSKSTPARVTWSNTYRVYHTLQIYRARPPPLKHPTDVVWSYSWLLTYVFSCLYTASQISLPSYKPVVLAVISKPFAHAINHPHKSLEAPPCAFVYLSTSPIRPHSTQNIFPAPIYSLRALRHLSFFRERDHSNHTLLAAPSLSSSSFNLSRTRSFNT